MKVFEAIAAILKLLPAVIGSVVAVERAIPGSGKGKEKFELVMDAVAKVSEPAAVETQLVGAIVNSVVATMNKTGTFAQTATKVNGSTATQPQ